MRLRIRGINRRDVAWVIGLLILAGAVIFTLISTTASNESLRTQYESLSAHYAELYEEAAVAGVEPSAPPPEDVPEPDDSAPQIPLPQPAATGATGATGERGPGPTQGQVVQALSTFCATNDCRPTPTVAQVAAAISDYCADGRCRGEDGDDGDVGETGEVGATGAAGRPPTSEEIATAVAAYCSDGSCRGATGATGERGPGPTNEQVLDQVRVFCAANNDCQGPQGATGAAGEPGKFKAGDYTCPDETPYMRGFSVQENGDWAVTCEAFPPGITTPES